MFRASTNKSRVFDRNSCLLTVCRKSKKNSNISFRVRKPLPKVPVPELAETMNKYLLCIRPIVSNDQYERTRQLVEQFQKPGGTGELLQSRLMEFAETTDNWVSLIAAATYLSHVLANIYLSLPIAYENCQRHISYFLLLFCLR